MGLEFWGHKGNLLKLEKEFVQSISIYQLCSCYTQVNPVQVSSVHKQESNLLFFPFNKVLFFVLKEAF